MAKDLAEKEREFIAALGGDTGRDLAQWMAAIEASGHARRNDIIDWLRQQGFAFPKASWLERIHHNGGRLIYGELIQTAATEPRAVISRKTESGSAPVSTIETAPPMPAASSSARAVPESKSEHGPTAQNDHAHSAANDHEVAAFLMAAKGLKPLADLILREIAEAVTGVRHSIEPPYLIIASPAAFAALLPAPKEIRLLADFGPEGSGRTRKAEAPRNAQTPFPDVLILNDARQVDGKFRELVAEAYMRSLK